MVIKKVTDGAFRKYGRIVRNIDFTELVETLNAKTAISEGVVYEPSVDILEGLPVFSEIQTKIYGELPIQIGYCNGRNYLLNAVEYHRSSEINIAATDAILMLGCQQDISDDFTYDTSLMEAFLVPEGVAVELYATTLHYAPCSVKESGYRVGVVLPKDTNLPVDKKHDGGEDRLIAAKNKWLIGHIQGGLPEGTYIGLIGKNLDCRE